MVVSHEIIVQSHIDVMIIDLFLCILTGSFSLN